MAKLYEGEATVVSVEAMELRDYQKKGLGEDEVANAFNISIHMENAAKESFVISLEVSSREGTGKAAGKKQSDMTYATLVQQKLISSAGVGASETDKISRLVEVFADAAIGRKVNIYQKESSSKDSDGNPYVNTYFSSGVRALPQKEIANRLAALTGKPVAKTETAAAADNEDIPF